MREPEEKQALTQPVAGTRRNILTCCKLFWGLRRRVESKDGGTASSEDSISQRTDLPSIRSPTWELINIKDAL
jgi:hypothetical protein